MKSMKCYVVTKKVYNPNYILKVIYIYIQKQCKRKYPEIFLVIVLDCG